MTWKTKPAAYLVLLLLWPLLSGCGVYSFSGAALSPDIKTFSVATFTNQSGRGPANLPQSMAENLRDYLQRNSNLSLVRTGGDLQYEGVITSYDVAPAGVQREGNVDIASANRLTIRVQVQFRNQKQTDQSFEQSFSYFADFPQSQALAQVEPTLIQTITDQIVYDIFNRSVANW